MNKNAFTMIELIFIIVVLGILASVAIPRLSVTRTDAKIAKGRSDIASIRSSIMTERQSQIIQGVSTFIPRLTNATTDDILFKGTDTRTLLTYGIKKGEWTHPADGNYTYTINGVATNFTYDSSDGTFKCTSGEGYCDKLVD